MLIGAVGPRVKKRNQKRSRSGSAQKGGGQVGEVDGAMPMMARSINPCGRGASMPFDTLRANGEQGAGELVNGAMGEP
ncbi:MAG: hypothetical protein C4K60_02940 [Ideonella sp. MAG2]|nr:MAG: hypothetical protein C4K60_02940 [Ideonella sp. MAG2]